MKRSLALVLCCATDVLAQTRPVRVTVPVPPVAREASAPAGGVLGARFGVAAAQRLLASSDRDERLRGVARLGDDGSREAIEVLVRAMDPGSALARDPRARLAATRALARHASEEGPRGVLLRAMSEALPPDRSATAAMIGETAALGLARYGEGRGVEVLAAVVRQGGRLGEVAAAALVAHPPASLEPLAGAKAPASPDVARLLGELGDLRALPWLRAVVRMNEPELRAAALGSLARLGDQEATVIARSFAQAHDPRARLAAARALALVSPDEARPLVAELLTVPASREDALSLAEQLGGGALTGALTELASSGALETRRRAVMALGLSPSGASVAALIARLEPDGLAPSAVLSLGLARSPDVTSALRSALGDEARRALAFRAGSVRAVALREAWPDDARVAADARAFLAESRGRSRPADAAILSSAPLASAVALGALARGPSALGELDELFCRAEGQVEHALAVVLLGGSRASDARLWALAESRGAGSALALFALAARDATGSRRRLDAWLTSPDPRARAHVVLGLARARDESRLGRIAAAYDDERDPDVRLAIIRALRGATSPAARAALELARELDPDARVRVAATSRGGMRLPRGELVTVVGAAAGEALLVERADGLALPVFVGSDGIALVPRASVGAGRASFAAAP